MSLLFILLKRTGCFAVSDQPTLGVVQKGSVVRVPFTYHLGVRLELWRACLIILTYDLFIFAQMISVRCHVSFAITLAEPSYY